MFLLNDYNRPGPGTLPDAPREKGLKRIWEMISRDYISFWLAGMINVLTFLPFALLAGYAYATHSLLIAILGGMIGGLIAAPGFFGLADTLLRSLRDEPGYWWHRYSRAMKNSWKSLILPGIVFGTAASVQIFILLHLQATDAGLVIFLSQIVSMTVFLILFLWTLCQHALLELSFGALIKNSILLALRYFGRSLAAAGIAAGYLLILRILFPGSVFLLITAGLWLGLLCCFQVIYPQIDEIFHIEKTLNEKLSRKAVNRE